MSGNASLLSMMKRIPPPLLMALLILIPLATSSFAARRPDTFPKLLAYSSAVGSLPSEVQDTLSWYDVLVVAGRPETIESLRMRNPDQRYLWPVLPQYVEPPEGDDPWWLPDTLWSIKRLQMYYAMKNDWYLRDTNGQIITDGTHYVINWTRFCPVGTFGSAKGLRASEWTAGVALPAIALSGRYWDPWTWDSETTYNGYMFEILADCVGSYGWETYQNADPDRDGDADGVYSTCSMGGTDDPLSVLFREENEVFYQRLTAAFTPEFVFAICANYDYVGPWWVDKLSGIRIENWMRSNNPDWVDWWDHFYGQTPPWEEGENHGGGYAWAEAEFDKPVGDYLKGWDLSIIQTWRDPNVPEEENQRQMRWGLGTALLGDGYFFYGEDARHPLWQPGVYRDLGLPLGDYFKRIYNKTDTLYVRIFGRGMVEVNPQDWPVRNIPARDARFYFWGPAVDVDVRDLPGAGASDRARLSPGEPNPFTAETRLDFSLPRPGPARLRILDTQGRSVVTLVESSLEAGPHTAVWDGRDERRRRLPAGVYHGQLLFEGRNEVVKVVLAR